MVDRPCLGINISVSINAVAQIKLVISSLRTKFQSDQSHGSKVIGDYRAHLIGFGTVDDDNGTRSEIGSFRKNVFRRNFVSYGDIS